MDKIQRQALFMPETNLPSRISTVAFATATFYGSATFLLPELHVEMTGVAIALCLAGITRLPEAIARKQISNKITKSNTDWTLYEKFISDASVPSHRNDFWLGSGFIWEPSHRQAVENFERLDLHELFRRASTKEAIRAYRKTHWKKCLRHPFLASADIAAKKECLAQQPGSPWLHALDLEKDLWIKNSDLEGHVAIFGTTGSGKSRCLEHMIVQKISKGEVVFVLDPKGDKGLERAMKIACEATNRENDFVRIHLGFPEESAHINLLGTYSTPSDLASRIADTLPSGGSSGQIFNDMGANVLKTLLNGFEIMRLKPSFKRLHYYFVNRGVFGDHVFKAYFAQQVGDHVYGDLINQKPTKCFWNSLKEYYEKNLKPNVVIDDIIYFVDRDLDNLQKTTISTMNLVSRLASGDIGEVLALESESATRTSSTDTRTLIEKKAVVYVGLSAMTDSFLARAIGSMFLSDLAATAGQRYNYEEHPNSRVSVFVDEAGEIACEPFVQMLNKSRGAGFTIFLATQTVADFLRHVKHPDEVKKILANVNNFIVLRTQDPDTQDFLMRRIQKTRIKVLSRSHGVSTSATSLLAQEGTQSEQEVEKEVDRIPKELLSGLPNSEYFAIVSGGVVVKGKVPLLLKSASEFRGN